MSPLYALIFCFVICAVVAALEGLCAGRNVRPFFASLKFPRYSAPLWLWSIIGGAYYLIFGFALYRVLRAESNALRNITLVFLICMMLINALTNYVIFRARNLRLSFIVGGVFPILDVILFVCLIQIDRLSAFLLLPYLIYRVYAVWWGYALWKENA